LTFWQSLMGSFVFYDFLIAHHHFNRLCVTGSFYR